jgi:hypothetical protein
MALHYHFSERSDDIRVFVKAPILSEPFNGRSLLQALIDTPQLNGQIYSGLRQQLKLEPTPK